jgi:tetratricopeptide (TPR) repeat protein
MLRTSLTVTLFVSLIGCGGSSASVNRESATKAYRAGLAAFEQQNYQATLENLTIAIGSGYLNPDLSIDALAKHAVANAALGNFDSANVDLERMKNAPDQSLFWAAKAFVLTKRGDTAEAAAALQQAKRLNPNLEPFK